METWLKIVKTINKNKTQSNLENSLQGRYGPFLKNVCTKFQGSQHFCLRAKRIQTDKLS